MRAPVLQSFPRAERLPPSTEPVGRRAPLVALQSVFWPCYGLALMVPWIGTYSVWQMLPSKVVVAATGVLASTLLALVHEQLAARRARLAAIVLVALALALPVGIAWDALLVLAFGQSVHFDLRALGSVDAGVPLLAGSLYHALILAMWSMMHLALRRPEAPPTLPTVPALAPGTDRTPLPPARLVLRDGRRHAMLAPDAIDWIEADGDYVRIHAGAKDIMLRSTMTHTEAALPPALYVRIHRSTIVRVSHVREVVARPGGELTVVLRDGRRLRGSRRFAARVRAAVGLGPA